ncbi:MAG: DUF3365 domain-containing protein [Planctomycetes bacterium]|nr:DUF3365 domain-containing protein [Planctomycetota bacterium]MCC7395939.1 DUF3365 domain-containing protein [Planctomycetota bacterium]
MTGSPRAVLLAFALFACGGPAAVTWSSLAEGAATPAQLATVARGEAAWQALGKTLLGELTAAVNERGAVAAIEVCRQRAPVLATEVARQHGVRLGRTSLRTRNAANTAPAWATGAIAANEPVSARFLASDGTVGLLQPIQLAPMCVQCHGKPDELAAGVGDALHRLYPEDRATGFAAGDLRGWFWVELLGN